MSSAVAEGLRSVAPFERSGARSRGGRGHIRLESLTLASDRILPFAPVQAALTDSRAVGPCRRTFGDEAGLSDVSDIQLIGNFDRLGDRCSARFEPPVRRGLET